LADDPPANGSTGHRKRRYGERGPSKFPLTQPLLAPCSTCTISRRGGNVQPAAFIGLPNQFCVDAWLGADIRARLLHVGNVIRRKTGRPGSRVLREGRRRFSCIVAIGQHRTVVCLDGRLRTPRARPRLKAVEFGYPGSEEAELHAGIGGELL